MPFYFKPCYTSPVNFRYFTALLMLALPTPFSCAGIYGHDDRIEAFEIQNPLDQKISEVTAAMIPLSHLSQTAHASYLVQAPVYGKQNQLCTTERFYDQPAAAGCSGFLIADDLVVTAGHCTEGRDICKDHVWAFGYRLTHAGQKEIEIPERNLYHCEVVQEKFIFDQFIDYSILKLDRKVEGFQPVSWRTKGSPRAGTPIVLAGFPRGLPLKLAAGFITETKPNYLVTNLDAYSVNSGSLVFNATTGEAEGILSAGPMDFTESATGCSISSYLPDSAAMTYVSRISLITGFLK
jgi:hypothetical protein